MTKSMQKSAYLEAQSSVKRPSKFDQQLYREYRISRVEKQRGKLFHLGQRFCTFVPVFLPGLSLLALRKKFVAFLDKLKRY